MKPEKLPIAWPYAQIPSDSPRFTHCDTAFGGGGFGIELRSDNGADQDNRGNDFA